MGDAARLLLRPWAVSDVGALRAAIDEDVGHLRPWLSWTLEEPASPERTRARLEGWAAQHRAGEGYRWAITRPADPARVLGGANLNLRFGPRAHDVGYWVRKSVAGQGLAGAAVSRLLVHAFEDRDVDRVVSQCDMANVASAGFARALGFEPIGEAEVQYPDGTPRPVLLFEVTRDAYVDRLAPGLSVRAETVELVTGY